MLQANSLNHLQTLLSKEKPNWVFVYKPNSQVSQCALQNIREVMASQTEINLLLVDAFVADDVHTFYGITSAPSLFELQNNRVANVIKGCHTTTYYGNLFNNSLFQVKSANENPNPRRVVVYSTPTCSWCQVLKSHLRQHRVPFQEVDVSRDQRAADELVRKSGQRGVPQTEINGEIIVGFNKTKINQLLGITG